MKKCLLVLSILISICAYSQNVSLDPSFGQDGVSLQRFAHGYDEVSDYVVLPDGKIVTTGDRLARFNKDYTLDTTFGSNGVVEIVLEKLAVQSDGKILGISTKDKTTKLIYRFLSDGTVDTTYGNNGVVELTDLETIFGISIAQQKNDKLLVSYKDQAIGKYKIKRFTTTGSLDTSFAEQGILDVIYYNKELSSTSTDIRMLPVIKVQSDDKIVIGGDVVDAAEKIEESYVAFAGRYNVDGTVDTTFGKDNDGFETIIKNTKSIEYNDNIFYSLTNLILSENNEISAILVQYIGSSDSNWEPVGLRDYGVTQLSSNGIVKVIKLNVRNEGYPLINGCKETVPTHITVLPDGGFLLMGNNNPSYGPGSKIYLMKYDSKLVLDETYNGNTGYLIVNKLDQYYQNGGNYGKGIILEKDGSSVVVGSYYKDDVRVNDIGFTKQTSAGQPDTSFGGDGLMVYDFPENTQELYSLALHPEGSIFMFSDRHYTMSEYANYANAVYKYVPGVINRLSADGSKDEEFNYLKTLGGRYMLAQNDGGFKVLTSHSLDSYNSDKSLNHSVSTFTVQGYSPLINTVAMQPDNKYLYVNVEDPFSQRISRRNADGSLDESFKIRDIKGQFGSMLVLPNNKIILNAFDSFFNQDIGDYTQDYLVRLSSDGSYETGIGMSEEDNGMYGDLILQSDGNILLFTTQRIQRHNSVDLSRDKTYGNNGVVDISSLKVVEGENNYALQADDKLLLNTINLQGNNEIVRLNKDGSIDTTFGTNGKYTFDSTYKFNSMLLQPDNKIVLGGTKDNGKYLAVVRLDNTPLKNMEIDEVVVGNKNEAILYPTIVSDVFYIKTAQTEEYSIEVYSTEGKLVKQGKTQHSSFNISNLSKGVYIVKLIPKYGKVITSKIIKK